MTIKDFIRKHRTEIDRIVYTYYQVTVRNDKTRLEWILSDEGLFRWAHQEGVNI